MQANLILALGLAMHSSWFSSVENCGMNFDWGLFQFTMTDCKNLVKGLKAKPTLHTLKIASSKVGEEEGRVLVKALLEHPGLTVLGI